MEDNAAKWMQVHKVKHDIGRWHAFMAAVEQKFGVYHYRGSIQDLLQVKQDNSVDVIPRSEKEGTKPPYVCPGCSNHTHGNNMINRCNVINKRVIFLT
jgi:hypothetical protein